MSKTRPRTPTAAKDPETEALRREAAGLTPERIRARLDAAAAEHQALVDRIAAEAAANAALIGDSERRLNVAVRRSQEEHERARELAARISDLEQKKDSRTDAEPDE